MSAKVLVFFCAALGIASASCFNVLPQQSVQVVSVPTSTESFSSGNAVELVSSGSSSGNSLAQVLSSGSSSGSSLAQVLSSGSSFGSSFGSSSGSSFGSSLGSSSFGVQAGNGPEATPITVVQAPGVTLPAVEGPVVTLSSDPIPAPRVLAQRCICTKTIVKPQIIQRQVTVPKLQRYIKRTVTPIVENVSYRSTPVSQGSSSSSASGLASGSSGFGSGSSGVVISGSSGFGSGSSGVVLSGSSSGLSSSSVTPVVSTVSSQSAIPVVSTVSTSQSAIPVISSSQSSTPVVISGSNQRYY